MADSLLSDELLEAISKQVSTSLKDFFSNQEVVKDSDEDEMEDDDDEDEGEYGLRSFPGEPTDGELEKIIELTGIESSKSDWLVVPCLASDNLVDLSLRRWGPSNMVQLGLSAVGRPLLVDHNMYETEAAKGFIFQASVIIDSECEDKILDAGGYKELNKGIIAKEGYNWLYLAAAVPVTSEAAEAVKNRVMNDVSTGSKLDLPNLLCNLCSEEHGRDVSFFETRKNAKGQDEYVCPHLIPSTYLQNFISMYGSEEDLENMNFADYATLVGKSHRLLELSLVNRGALPAAGVCRNH